MQNNEKTESKSARRMPLHRQPIFIILIILVIVVVTVIIVLLINNQGKESNLPENNETSSGVEDTPAPLMESDDASGDKKVVQYEGEDPNELEEITGIVTYAGVEGTDLTVSTMVDQYITDGGTCTLTLTNKESGESYNATSGLVADITTSYCENLTLPASNLPSGEYQIEIVVEGGNKKGTIESEVNL